ncbi:uncharacterized protein LOC125652330 [Ostrea edulis]|uniref:uncharacterized protein LOC125652330 n=1 Tax=Ostrea edulis TaxID=37623 RepID=UPI0024AF4912|nr:uncharacterized protein LOC125652330 [Ostrea edulis]
MNRSRVNSNGVPKVADSLAELDLHLDLEDLTDMTESDSDSSEEQFSEEEWPSANEEEEELMKLTHDLQATDAKRPAAATHPEPHPPPQKVSKNNGALIPYDDGIDVDSEEENEIMKEIKAEISKQMREEMKSELEVYKQGVEALEQGQLPGAKVQDREEEGLENMEPKMKEAILKMRKLDKILSKKIKKEKEVKRDRILLERRIKEEIEAMKSERNGEYREEKNNTDKYLALTLPPRHNEGVSISQTPGPDVFTTELNEADYPGLKKDQPQGETTKRSAKHSSQNNFDQDTSSEFGSEMSAESKKRNRRKKNFIKRNKELAKDAGSEVAMTDEEKLRVEDLLKDLDELPDVLEDEDDTESCYQVAVRPGEGFWPDPDEMRVLDGIDSRLKEILPPEEFDEVSARHPQMHHKKLFTPVGFKNLSSFEHFGERTLLENKEQREMRSRLHRIEEELAKLHNPEEIEIETPDTLSGEQLNDLLDQCARSMSRSTLMGGDSRISQRDRESRDTQRSAASSRASMPESDADSMYLPSEDTTPRSQRSAREILMENPPKLSDEDLQKLLSDAHFPLRSRLSTLMEVEEDNGQEQLETEVESRPSSISAETWQLISQEKTQVDDQSEFDKNIDDSVMFSSVSDTEYSSSRNSQIPVLPEINRSGSLIAQWNNERPFSGNSRNSSVLTIRNSLNVANVSDSLEIMSIGTESVSSTPRPPSGDKPSNLSQRAKMERNVIQSS